MPGRSKLHPGVCHAASAIIWLVFSVLVLYAMMLWWWDRPYWLDLLSHFAVHVGFVWVLLTIVLACTKHRRVAFVFLVAGSAHWLSV